MPVLNTANALRLGTQTVAAAYAGVNKVWPVVTTTPPVVQGITAFISGIGSATTTVWPAHITGDIAFHVCEASGDSAVISVPAGWTLMCDLRDVSTLNGSRFHVLARRATSNAEAPAPFPAQIDHKFYGMVTVRNVDPSIPLTSLVKATAIKIPTSASNIITFPSVTTPVANCRLMMFGSRPNDDGSLSHFSNPTNAALTGLTEVLEYGNNVQNGGGIVIATGVKVAAGVTGATVMNKLVSTSDTSLTVALPPIP